VSFTPGQWDQWQKYYSPWGFSGILQCIWDQPPAWNCVAVHPQCSPGSHPLCCNGGRFALPCCLSHHSMGTTAPQPSPGCAAGSLAVLPAPAHRSQPTSLMQLALFRIVLPHSRCLSCLESGIANARLKHPIQQVFPSRFTLNCMCRWITLHCFPLQNHPGNLTYL